MGDVGKITSVNQFLKAQHFTALKGNSTMRIKKDGGEAFPITRHFMCSLGEGGVATARHRLICMDSFGQRLPLKRAFDVGVEVADAGCPCKELHSVPVRGSACTGPGPAPWADHL